MAEPGERFGRTYHYDPAGQWVVLDEGGGIVETTTIDAISNGALTQRGNIIFQRSPWRILWNIPVSRDAMVTSTSNGRILFSNGIPPGSFNRELGPSTVYSAAGRFYLETPDETPHEFEVSYMNLTAIGTQLWYNPDVYGKGRFSEVPFESLNSFVTEELSARGYKPAPVDEAINRSAVSYLLRYYRRELDRIWNKYAEEYGAGGIKTIYQLAQMLAATNIDGLDVYVSRIYDPSKA